jgi:hypothetical protein
MNYPVVHACPRLAGTRNALGTDVRELRAEEDDHLERVEFFNLVLGTQLTDQEKKDFVVFLRAL